MGVPVFTWEKIRKILKNQLKFCDIVMVWLYLKRQTKIQTGRF